MNTNAVEKIVQELEARGIAAEDLDELIHELHQDSNLDQLNSLSSDADQDDFVDSVSQCASSVNNGGLTAQITWLLNYYKGNVVSLQQGLSPYIDLPKAA